jgi:hypothetical protein
MQWLLAGGWESTKRVEQGQIRARIALNPRVPAGNDAEQPIYGVLGMKRGCTRTAGEVVVERLFTCFPFYAASGPRDFHRNTCAPAALT